MSLLALQKVDNFLIHTGGILVHAVSKPIGFGCVFFEDYCDHLGAVSANKICLHLPVTYKDYQPHIAKAIAQILKISPIAIATLVIANPFTLTSALIKGIALCAILAATKAHTFKHKPSVGNSETTIRLLQGIALAISMKGSTIILDNLYHGNFIGASITFTGMTLLVGAPLSVSRFIQTHEANQNKSESELEVDENKANEVPGRG